MYGNWCFTWNNFPADVDSRLEAFFKRCCCYMIFGFEHCGPRPAELAADAPWTRHVQGYLQLHDKMRRTQLSAAEELSNEIHWEDAHGTPEQNETYCGKENIRKLGEARHERERVDIRKILADSGDIYDVMDNHPEAFLRAPGGWEKLM